MDSTWWQALGKDNRGSRPRCISLIDASSETTASRLTDLIGLEDVSIASSNVWMPRGKPVKRGTSWDLRSASEARLDRDPGFVPPEIQQILRDWWLAVAPRANTPNWDLASTCTVDGKRGLLLVEAKAHANELSIAGKSLPSTDNGWKNHESIALAIAEANAELERVTTTSWSLSRDHHYQLSNRFAWAWKLVSLGVPVILVYLGFLDAEEMRDVGTPFRTSDDWITALTHHAVGTVDNSCWEQQLDFSGVPLRALIRTWKQPFPPQ